MNDSSWSAVAARAAEAELRRLETALIDYAMAEALRRPQHVDVLRATLSDPSQATDPWHADEPTAADRTVSQVASAR